MVYFQISPVGFDCGIDKDKCDKYPDYCKECVKAKFQTLGLDVKDNLKFTIVDSEEKRIHMFQDLIWQKFLDVLNIKHILLMAKESGLAIVDYPISGTGVNTQLLTGFIQANLSFSVSNDKSKGIKINGQNHQFYEFQYKNFNILLKNGEFIRVCLVLDHKASDSLKSLTAEFLGNYERNYSNKINEHIQKGKMRFEDTIDFVLDTFNVRLVFPMVLSHTVMPDELEQIKRNPIQKAILDFAQKLLVAKAFFFIINLIDEVQKIVHIDANKILYEVHQLIEKKIIIPTTIEIAEDTINNFQESRAVRIANNELISSLITSEDNINELKEKAKNMNEEEVSVLINNFLKKAETAEKGLAYKEAQKEYEKALFLASGFDFKDEVGRISFMVFELDKKIKELELEYALKFGEKAEKKKDYINAIKYYQQGLKILKDVQELNGNESRIKKLKKKIKRLQKHL
jgi:tetratricopeptide (TPR) repeat protein